MKVYTSAGQGNEKPDTVKWRAVLMFLVFALLLPLALLVAAGRFDWVMGWMYAGMLWLSTIGSRAAVRLKNPELLAERAQYRQGEGVKGWDRVLVPLVGMYGPLAMWIVAGLDERFGWTSRVLPALQWVALVLVALGFAFASWAMVANKFFSAVVRIQKDREHAVVTDGPYRVVRHPGYAGAVLAYLATPVMLDALWAFVPALLTVVALIVRTALEDRTLCQELPGYAEYTRRTRYRLLPGVW